VCDPTGFPVWASPVEPGSTHDISAARAHVLPALYPAAANGLPTLTDKGYTGAGIGILKTRWTALQRVRLCPWRIGDITAAALVLSTLERGSR
jgi:hypothetical protein